MAELPTIDNGGSTKGRRRGRPTLERNGKRDGGSVQSLDRALGLMEAISYREQGATLSDLAQETALAPSTAHRLLKSLESREYLRQDEERGLWFIGVRAFTVGSAFVRVRDIVAVARPFMRVLVEEVGESANLAILEDNQPVYLSQVECQQMIRAHALPGVRAMPHCSGIGKAFLALMPAARVEAIMASKGMPALTSKTITSIDDYQLALADVRRHGYAVDDEEQSPGMRCVAAVIFDDNSEAAAALSITGPSARIAQRRIPELGAKVRDMAAQVTAAIGGVSP
jgi:IclR family acetate operon transcriptional repressor